MITIGHAIRIGAAIGASPGERLGTRAHGAAGMPRIRIGEQTQAETPCIKFTYPNIFPSQRSQMFCCLHNEAGECHIAFCPGPVLSNTTNDISVKFFERNAGGVKIYIHNPVYFPFAYVQHVHSCICTVACPQLFCSK